jgi:DUF971 family protein
MDDPKARPTGITLDKEKRELRVSWADGHESAYPLDALRKACPCATCRGGPESPERERDPNVIELKPIRSHSILEIRQVGNYAIRPVWDDGHSAGIYSWEYLRSICPCPICQAGQES